MDVEKHEDLLALAEAAKTLHFYVQSDQSAEILETQVLRLIDALSGNPHTRRPDGVWFDQTPISYFIESGQLIDRLLGWPSDDQGARLTDQIQSFLEPSDK